MLYLSCSFDDPAEGLLCEHRLSEALENLSQLYKRLVSAFHVKRREDFGDSPNPLPRPYGNLSPTAALVAYYRAFSDIPFAKEVANMVQAQEMAKDLIVPDEAHLAKVLVAFEARFKSVDSVLRKYPGITRIIEIPAGFSTRGLAMTTADSSLQYLECDLPLVIADKEKLIAQLASSTGIEKKAGLRFRAASVLDLGQLRFAAASFDEGPIAIITEGLFSYLTPQEKIVVARNIHAILKEHGGLWIVTDLTRIFKIGDVKAAELRKKISSSTGFSPIAGCFGSIAEAKTFFNRIGFSVHDYRRSEVIDSLSTSNSSWLTRRKIQKLLEPQATFALEV